MSSQTAKLTLLLIDDDQTFLSVLKRRLEQTSNYEVHIFNSVEQALALQHANVHGILLDMMLGDDSGLDGIVALKTQFSPQHLIMLSGYASIATTVEAMRRGATDYVAKPISLSELLQRLQNTQVVTDITQAKPMTKAQAEWEHIQRVLLANQGNISLTAEALGMHRRSLQRKLQKYSPSKS